MANDAEKRLQQQAVVEAERDADKGNAPKPPPDTGPPQNANAPLPVHSAQPGQIAPANRPIKQPSGTLELVEGIALKAMHLPKGSQGKEVDSKGMPAGDWVEANFAPEGHPVKIPKYAVSAAVRARAFHGNG